MSCFFTLGRGDRSLSQILTFFTLFSFWVLLSGYLDAFHLIAGMACSFFVTYFSKGFLFGSISLKTFLKRGTAFLKYLPWLLIQITKANLDMAYRTLHPKMPIRPHVFKKKTSLQTKAGLVILANSITLTPGTVTIDVQPGEYVIHAITEYAQNDFEEMQNRVISIERH